MNIFSQKDVDGVQELIKNENGKTNPIIQSNPTKDEIEELNEQSQRIQELIDEIDALPDANARKLMQECIQEVLSFYGHGLEKILGIISKENESAVHELIKDSFVNGLLLIHDLHPLDLKTRLYQALDKVKPYMDSHGGSVEVVSLENGMAKLKLLGSCKGCPSSAATLELGIKEAIEENCPDLMGLEVEGLTAPSKSGNGSTQTEKGWHVLNGLNQLKDGEMKSVLDSSGTLVLICRVHDRLYAYRNLCPACDRPFTSGTLEQEILSCQLGHRYDLTHAGICTDNSDIHLDPFPLLEENGIVKISVG